MGDDLRRLRPPQAREGYRSASGLARVLRGLFAAIVVLVGITAIAELFQIELLGRIATGEFTEDEAVDNDFRLAQQQRAGELFGSDPPA